MSMEIYLKIPGVDGESQAKGHEKEIEVLSFSLGASNPSGVKGGTGSGAGKVDISSINISKQVDIATAKLFLKCCNGKHFDTGTLTFYEAGGDDKVEYWKIDLKEVYIDSISWGGGAGSSGKPSESVSISFAEIKFQYFSQTEKGVKGDKGEGGWNIKTNAAAA